MATTVEASGLVATGTSVASAATCNGFDATMFLSGGAVHAEGDVICNNGETHAAYMRIERKNSNGTTTIVAAGPGEIAYPCHGTATNTYLLWHAQKYWIQRVYACG